MSTAPLSNFYEGESMPLNPRQAATLELHRQLDIDLYKTPKSTGRFISGYQTTHPFIQSYMDGVTSNNGNAYALGRYSFAQSQSKLIDAIRSFHQQADGIDYSPDEILLSAGSSPLLMSLMLFLRQRAIGSLYYFRPIYHTLYFFADLLDVRLLPVCDHLLLDTESPLKLPDGEHVLLFSDPVWIVGREVGDGAIDAVRRWQERTGSTVIVDGTFQYLKWDWPARREGSTRLIRDQTIRLICPTKSLAIHGIRFAYLLGPARLLKGLRWVCDNTTGSASTFDLHTAAHLMDVLSSPDSNRHLLAYIRARYSELRNNNFISRTAYEPDCGYYVFGQVGRSERTDLFMGADYFELDGYDDFVRVNLLSPDIMTISANLNPAIKLD